MKHIITKSLFLGTGLLLVLILFGQLYGQGTNNESPAVPDTPALSSEDLENYQPKIPPEVEKKIAEHYWPELMKTPGVTGIVPLSGEGVIAIEAVVFTDANGVKPASLPPEIAALPKEIEGFPVQLNIVYSLPPPPGVIILKPGGVRQQAEACPEGYLETKARGWRFCLDRAHPEPIPPLWVPPIAGIPYEEALKILERHRSELLALPGVHAVGMGGTGIFIRADKSAILPESVEGLPFEVHPWYGPWSPNSHSLSTAIRPVRGALWISGPNHTQAGTLMAIGFDCGMWLIFPSHLVPDKCGAADPLGNCTEPSLRDCLKRYTPDLISQPPAVGTQPVNPIGHLVKWTRLLPNTLAYDMAAAWADNDFNQGNGSLCVDRLLEQRGDWTGTEESTPAVRDTVYLISANGPHVIRGMVTSINETHPVAVDICQGNARGSVGSSPNEFSYTPIDRGFQNGDSGSAVVTADNKLLGMHVDVNTNQPPSMAEGGAVPAPLIRTVLGFSKWYTLGTFPNNPQVCQ